MSVASPEVTIAVTTTFERQRVGLAGRWHRAIARSGAVPYSAPEIRARLLDLLDVAIRVLAGDAGREAAISVGTGMVTIGYRSPEALGSTLELLSTVLVEDLSPEAEATLRPRMAMLLSGVAAGFSAAGRQQLLDEQESSRAAVLAENRRAWGALRRQAALLDLAPDAILVRQIGTGIIAFWNHGAETLYRWGREEAVGQSAHALLRTESPLRPEEIEAIVFGDGHWEGELVHIRRDGTPLIVSSRWAPQWDDDGNPLACLEINTDITARKQIEAALREREATLERAQSLAHLGSWEVNLAEDIHDWSPEAYRLLGYADREVVATRATLFNAVHSEDVARVQQAIQDALAGNTYQFEMRALGRDGVERVLLCQNEVIRDEDGQPRKLVGTALDITERKRAEAERVQLSATEAARSEAEAARQRFAFLADASRVLGSSLDYQVTLRSVTDLAVPTLAEACLVDVVGDDGVRTRAAETSGPHLGLARDAHLDLQQVLTSGRAELRPRSMLVPLFLRGRAHGIIAFLAGTDRPAYTEIDLALAEELARRCDLAIENARLHAEAQRATRLRDEFLSVAAHELKTPMTTLRGYAQWLLRSVNEGQTSDAAVVERALRAIDTQTVKLVDLTSQLLDISRIEAGKLSLERRQVDLVPLVRAALDSAQTRTHNHILDLHAQAPCEAVVDPLRFEQVMSNLIGNAVKYSPDGGVIDVLLARPSSGEVQIEVRDHGLGIPEARRENLFDRFYQAHGEGHYGGLGLGLYISRQIVELHGGRIWAEFPEDGGSRFLISLPGGTDSLAPIA